MAVFGGTKDRYGGITVTSSSEACPEQEVEGRLSVSLAKWKEEKVRVAWFHVAPQQASWIPLLVSF